MCGRKTLIKNERSIIKELMVDEWRVDGYEPSYNIAPTQYSPIMVNEKQMKNNKYNDKVFLFPDNNNIGNRYYIWDQLVLTLHEIFCLLSYLMLVLITEHNYRNYLVLYDYIFN